MVAAEGIVLLDAAIIISQCVTHAWMELEN